jgi:hypothetical protein
MRNRLAMPVHTVALALLSSVVSVAQAQTPQSKLILRADSLKPLLQPGMLAQDAVTPERLHIEILKGDGGVNILGADTAVQPVIQVRDRNNRPLPDVTVTFTAPADGPSATFLNGSRSISLTTDSAGEAILLGMKPVNPGRFQIAVSASVQSETVVTAISLMNEAAAHAAATVAKKQGLSKGVIFAIVGGVAAAAIGIGVGMGGHGSAASSGTSNSTGSSASIGLGSGGVTAGPPH